MKKIKEEQLRAALNEVALLKAKLHELGLIKASDAMEIVVRTTGMEIAELLKHKQIKDFREKLNADVDGILGLHKKGQAYIPQEEWEAFVKSMRKTGRPPKEKTLWDSPAAQRLVKGLRRKRK